MADDITYTSTTPAGVPNATKQVTDEHATRGHMPVVKQAVSADGDATLIPATAADGLLVNLGTNNDVTVTGTVTANLGAVDNAVLDDIAADTEAIKTSLAGTLTVTGGGGGTEYTVDAAAPAAPTGGAPLMERDDALSTLTEIEGDWTNQRANARGALWVAVDDTATVSIDDGGGAITVDGTVTANLAAGTNNIGDVDVLSVVPGTGATALGKAEDAAHTTGDTGVSILGVRRDTAATSATTDGDYATVNLDATGRLWTHDPVAEALLTTIDADTSNLSVVGGGTEAAAIRVTIANNSTGVLSVDDNGSTLSIDDGGGAITVDGTVAATQSGTWTEANSAAALTSLQLIDDAVYTDGTGTPSKAVAVAGTDGTNPQILSTNATGHVNIADGGNSITVDGTITANAGTGTMAVSNTVLSVVGGGTEAAAQRVTIASDSTGVLSVDDNGGSLTVDVGTALPAGSNAIGKLAANSGVDIGDVDVLSIAAGTNAIGNMGVIPRTSGGLTIFRSVDLDETEEEIKASAGQVFGWYIFNGASSTRYVKFYNATAASVTVGTTTPVLTIPVPAGAAANVFSEIGIAFSTAISAAATTGVADADTGAPGANEVIVNVFYS